MRRAEAGAMCAGIWGSPLREEDVGEPADLCLSFVVFHICLMMKQWYVLITTIETKRKTIPTFWPLITHNLIYA